MRYKTIIVVVLSIGWNQSLVYSEPAAPVQAPPITQPSVQPGTSKPIKIPGTTSPRHTKISKPRRWPRGNLRSPLEISEEVKLPKIPKIPEGWRLPPGFFEGAEILGEGLAKVNLVLFLLSIPHEAHEFFSASLADGTMSGPAGRAWNLEFSDFIYYQSIGLVPAGMSFEEWSRTKETRKIPAKAFSKSISRFRGQMRVNHSDGSYYLGEGFTPTRYSRFFPPRYKTIVRVIYNFKTTVIIYSDGTASEFSRFFSSRELGMQPVNRGPIELLKPGFEKGSMQIKYGEDIIITPGVPASDPSLLTSIPPLLEVYYTNDRQTILEFSNGRLVQIPEFYPTQIFNFVSKPRLR